MKEKIERIIADCVIESNMPETTERRKTYLSGMMAAFNQAIDMIDENESSDEEN